MWPRLFTLCMQEIIVNKINWGDRGININGEHLCHLDFADNIILIAHTPKMLNEMLKGFHKKASQLV